MLKLSHGMLLTKASFFVLGICTVLFYEGRGVLDVVLRFQKVLFFLVSVCLSFPYMI